MHPLPEELSTDNHHDYPVVINNPASLLAKNKRDKILLGSLRMIWCDEQILADEVIEMVHNMSIG